MGSSDLVELEKFLLDLTLQGALFVLDILGEFEEFSVFEIVGNVVDYFGDVGNFSDEALVMSGSSSWCR